MSGFKVTLKDIYNVVEKIDERTQDIDKHCIETNGKVKLNRWIATTALSLVVIAIGLIMGGI